MGEVIIPNLEEVTPGKCIGCNPVRHKIRIGVGEIACADIEQAREVEQQWADFLEPCEGNPSITGYCGEEQQECRHPAKKEGVIAWRPGLS